MKLFDGRDDMLIETKIKPNIKVIYEMKIKGLSDKYISQALGIPEVTFVRLIEKSELLKDTYQDALMIFSSKLNDVVIGRALGTDGRTDKDGNLLPPDEKLAFKLLEKFDPRFSSKVEIKETVSIEMIIRQIAEGKNKEIN